jgi:hypothetical protein
MSRTQVARIPAALSFSNQELQVVVERVIERMVRCGLDRLGVLTNLACEITEGDDHSKGSHDFSDIP